MDPTDQLSLRSQLSQFCYAEKHKISKLWRQPDVMAKITHFDDEFAALLQLHQLATGNLVARSNQAINKVVRGMRTLLMSREPNGKRASEPLLRPADRAVAPSVEKVAMCSRSWKPLRAIRKRRATTPLWRSVSSPRAVTLLSTRPPSHLSWSCWTALGESAGSSGS